jgi:PAS domain S-box-containing protein
VAERIPHHAAKILNECTTAESKLLAGETDDSLKDASELIPSSLKPSPLTSNIASNLINSVSSSSLQQAKPVKQNAKILMEPDYRLIHSLVNSQQNFVLSDPSLPDNPIVYASEGFCKMTGYKRHEVLGRNCRFLQGPGTDQAAVDIIRKGITEGRDISVCLLNYKADGTPFWNQFFLAALRDGDGNVVNYVGVQCEVNTIPVLEIKDRVKKLPIPNDL